MNPQAALAEDRYEFVRQFLGKNPASKDGVLFDIGAGAQPMKADVKAAGYKWLGFDLVPKSADVTQWDVTTPFKGAQRADVILLMDVIEHTFNPGLALANIAKVMKPGGKLIITVPNPRWSRARTLHLFTGFVACFTQHDLDVNHHVFATWQHIMLKLVADCGLQVDEYVTLDRDEADGKGFSPARAFEGLIRKAIEARDASARGMSYAFVVSRKA